MVENIKIIRKLFFPQSQLHIQTKCLNDLVKTVSFAFLLGSSQSLVIQEVSPTQSRGCVVS